jgi:hypothetical protein
MMLLKMDFFFFLTFASQFIFLVLRPDDRELTWTIILIPMSVFSILLASFATRKESRFLMSLFSLFSLTGIIYFGFKLFRFYDPTQRHKYVNYVKFLTFSGSVCLFLTIATFVFSLRCMRNFNKGLVDRMKVQKLESQNRSLTL